MKQDYSSYDAEAFDVWKLLFERQVSRLQRKACSQYFAALETLELRATSIPDVLQLESRLLDLTGWRLEVVESLLPPREYFGFLAERRFPVTVWLRSRRELEHVKAPDMFHDVFGHLPLLTEPDYGVWIEGISALAMGHLGNPRALDLIAQVNKWTVEFGLIESADGPRIYGAGLVSSSGEMEVALDSETVRLDAEVDVMLATPHRMAEYQPQYFVIPSFDWFPAGLEALRRGLPERLRSHPA